VCGVEEASIIFILDLRPRQQVDPHHHQHRPQQQVGPHQQLYFYCTPRPQQPTNQDRRRAAKSAKAAARLGEQVGFKFCVWRLRFQVGFKSCVWRLRCQVDFKCCVWRLLLLFYFPQGVGKICEVCTSECLLTFHVRDRFQAGSPSWTVTDVDSISASLVWTSLSRPQDVDIVVCQSGQGRSSGIPVHPPTINDRILRLRPEEVRRPDEVVPLVA
jgi:hypothetical protein